MVSANASAICCPALPDQEMKTRSFFFFVITTPLTEAVRFAGGLAWRRPTWKLVSPACAAAARAYFPFKCFSERAGRELSLTVVDTSAAYISIDPLCQSGFGGTVTREQLEAISRIPRADSEAA